MADDRLPLNDGVRLVVILLFLATMWTVSTANPVERNDIEKYPYQDTPIQYDEYPVVVPKRTALMLDRMMVALQNALENEEETGSRAGGSGGGSGISNSISTGDTMGLQRRGHGGVGGQQKGRVYWRCYFNAVTCFKRK